MNYDNLKEKALNNWNFLTQGDIPLIKIGSATCGRAAGALEVAGAIRDMLVQKKIRADVIEVGCIGTCYLEPVISVLKPGAPEIFYGNVTPETGVQIIVDYLLNNNPHADMALGTIGSASVHNISGLFDLAMFKGQKRTVLKNCGKIDPLNINHYLANDGYSGLVKALKMSPASIIDEVKKAGLRGRGGAGFSAGLKWELCRNAPGEIKYIICNADEGDPGAFMNRTLLESDPHSVIEGMIIGAYAIGSHKGFIYCRAEKPLAIERLKIALKQSGEYGFTGKNILGSGFDFELEIREGAGAFVCGEETALIASIEGDRGMPNPRPPYPAQSGLWGKPTNINNVETWANVSIILQQGSSWYSGTGSTRSKGTKTFALAGKIKHTGLIEVPIGISLKDIIYKIGGGVPNDKQFKAIQTGGPSGGCIPAHLLDLPVDYESLAEAGSIMGSGGMIVLDEDNCMVDIARFFMKFIQSESCGKCVPCRLGTKQMLDILDKIATGKGKMEDIDLLLELAGSIKAGSLCGLGQTSPNPVLTTLRYFKCEYEEHIKQHLCRAGVCKELISYVILAEKCQGCGACLKMCPVRAIEGKKKFPHDINSDKCIKCGVCLDTCRFGAIEIVSGLISGSDKAVSKP